MRVPPGGHVVAGRRLVVAGVLGVVAGVAAALTLGPEWAPVVTWIVAAAVHLAWTWLVIGRMDAATTALRATREDPTIGASHLVLLLASLASLGGVALLLVASSGSEAALAAALGVASVAASWLTVHTVYTLGYAAAYYAGTPGGIDFNQQEPPAYADFAYLGFTLGMTYQVSDTSISDPGIRAMVLRQSLLSYLLGAVVLGVSINAVAGLIR